MKRGNWIMVFQRDLVRAAEHFLRVARCVFPSPIGDPCELPRSPFMRTDLGLVPGQLWLSNIDVGDVALSQGLDVSHGLLPEESTVLAAELAHTLVVGISKIGNCGRRTGRPYATSCQRTI